MELLWNMLVPDEADTTVPPHPYYWKEYKFNFIHTPVLSFCQPSDEIGRKRTKVTHTQGLVAQVKYTPIEGQPYTGMFAETSKNVLLRFSETNNLIEASTGLLPSLALKWLVDGKKAANAFGMPSFAPSSSWNFFHAPMRSRVEPLTSELEIETIVKKLVEASAKPYAMGIGWIGDQTGAGEVVPTKEVKIPYELRFTFPAKEAHSSWEEKIIDEATGEQ